MMTSRRWINWFGRVLIGLVALFNVQCALAFLISPEQFAPGLELSGDVGSGMVRGLGILFLMWNVPYLVAVMDPIHRRSAVYEAVVMQSIGFVGESILLATFPAGHPLIGSTLLRFIYFDGSGLIALLLAAWITHLPAGEIKNGISAKPRAEKS